MSKEDKAVDVALAALEKKYGNTVITKLDADPEPLDAIPTGIISVDRALGIGGFPKGRIVELHGTESSGKTTLALKTVDSAQKLGYTCAYVDAEHALDPAYAHRLGVDTSALLLSQPSSGEEAIDVVSNLVRTGQVGVVVVDSVAALTPQAEIDGEIEDQNVALLARLMARAVKRLTHLAHESDALIIFINQLREKPGQMYGPTTTTPGGRSLKYQSSVRVAMRHKEKKVNKSTGEVLGARVAVEVIKNKVAPPFRKAEFDIVGHKGVDLEAELADLAVDYDLIEKKGAWFARDGNNIAHGRNQLIQLLESDAELREELYSRTYELVFGG